MIGKKYSLFLLLSLLFSHTAIYSFAVSDIEIVPKMRDNDPDNRTYVIDTEGNDTKFLKPGIEFSVFRNDAVGTLNHVGVLKAISTGKRYCKAIEKALSVTLFERNLDIKNIAKGDVAIPSYTMYSEVLFQALETPVLTMEGLDIISNKVVPLINTESFTRIKINVYNDNGWDSDLEIELGDFQAEAIKRHLGQQFDIPSGFVDVESFGNLQNLYADAQKVNNNRVEVLFLSGEEIIKNDAQNMVAPPMINSPVQGGFLTNNVNVNLQPTQTNTFTINENYPSQNMQPTQISAPVQNNQTNNSPVHQNQNQNQGSRDLEETKDVGDIILRED